LRRGADGRRRHHEERCGRNDGEERSQVWHVRYRIT
jgi:hypothetical protein